MGNDEGGRDFGLREGMRVDVGDTDGCLFVGTLIHYRQDETTGSIEMTVQ